MDGSVAIEEIRSKIEIVLVISLDTLNATTVDV
jgi:hypothetical protein